MSGRRAGGRQAVRNSSSGSAGAGAPLTPLQSCRHAMFQGEAGEAVLRAGRRSAMAGSEFRNARLPSVGIRVSAPTEWCPSPRRGIVLRLRFAARNAQEWWQPCAFCQSRRRMLRGMPARRPCRA